MRVFKSCLVFSMVVFSLYFVQFKLLFFSSSFAASNSLEFDSCTQYTCTKKIRVSPYFFCHWFFVEYKCIQSWLEFVVVITTLNSHTLSM